MSENTIDYDHYTLFPWSLAKEVVELARSRGATFRTYGQTRFCRSLWRVSPKLASRLEFLTAAPSGTLLQRLIKVLPRRVNLKSMVPGSSNTSIEVYLQHDADRQVYKTLEMIGLESKLGAISSNYFFYERHLWDSDRESYLIPVETLRLYEDAGFEIGYHLNAYELGNYDLGTAVKVMERDVSWFRTNFALKSYVPHGGVRGPEGINNEMMPQVGSLSNLIWAYNRFGVYCDVQWSDGDVRGSAPVDPREVMKAASSGSRIRFLMHPQYYGNSLCRDYKDYAISKSDWWRKLWGL